MIIYIFITLTLVVCVENGMVGMEVDRTIKIVLSSQADEILNYVITDGDRSRKRKHIFKFMCEVTIHDHTFQNRYFKT